MFEEIDLLILAILFVAGAVTFSISTISGGGGALLLIPFVSFLLGTGNTAPIVNLGSFIGRPVRLFLFWNDIVWKLVWYYVPSAVAGAILAAWLFAEVRIVWIQLAVALFLISTIFQYRFGKKERSFEVKKWHFIPLGFVVSVIGTFTGGMGPVLNPFYLNAGITKERLIATKTVNSFVMGLTQISSYAFFGLLYGELWIYGISLGLGVSLGNIIGKKALAKMSAKRFRQWVIVIMVISGVLMLINLLIDYYK